MTVSSNIYASRVFSEHPIALYPLDDDAAYISLLADSYRFFDSGSWIVSNGVPTDNPTLPDTQSPFKNSDIYSGIIGDAPTTNAHDIEWESPTIFAFSDLSQTLKTFAINFYLFQDCLFTNWYEVGYIYYDPFLAIDREVVTRIEAPETRSWVNFNLTYLPSDFSNNQVRLLIRANVRPGGGAGDYNFIVNGLSVGQWSETTSSKSLGVVPNVTPLTGTRGIPATQYGFEENSGYYLVDFDDRLLAKNYGIPMIYGSDNVTRIYPASVEGDPSLIIPGYGFLNEVGRYQDYTFEFWLRINPITNQSLRIFGPVNSDYGIYVRDGTIALLVGNQIGTHAISEWFRPMIVHFILKDDSAILLINGEQVINIPYDKKSIILSDIEDWVGFYSFEDIELFEIDCIAIYPYAVPEQVAKKRFVWGQAVGSTEEIARYFDGKNAFINFANSNYTSNKTYPDILNWDSGYYNNMIATKTSLSAPNYQLPEVYIGGRNKDDLYASNKELIVTEDDIFFTFRPSVSIDVEGNPSDSFDTDIGYIKFDSINFINNLSSIYGVFSTVDFISENPILLIKNTLNNDTFLVKIFAGELLYYFNDELLYKFPFVDYPDWFYNYYGYHDGLLPQEESPFAVGIDIAKISTEFGYQVSRFFQSPENLQVYVGGDGVDTFDGKMYKFGFADRENHVLIADKFSEEGILELLEYEDMANHYATYTLAPLVRYNRFFLDINVSARWEEYFPLTMFASYIQNRFGQSYYDLDYMQINFGYPSILERASRILENLDWTYGDLFDAYNAPIQRSYEFLDNSLFTGYGSYDDLANNRTLEYFLSTAKSGIKTYFTFQLLNEGANRPVSAFQYQKSLPTTRFVDANEDNSESDLYRSYKTAYEFVDKTVVYPPRSIDFQQVAFVVHFEINQEGILSNPLKFRDFEIASKALNQNTFDPIKTESGGNLYPYVKEGIYFDSKATNPVLISKKIAPYLYLTSDSGIKVLGEQDLIKEHVISMPINENAVEGTTIGAVQIWMKYDQYEFPSAFYPVFEIQDKEKTIEFVLRADPSGQRGNIFARNKKTKQIYNDIIYYQNGLFIKSPVIELNEWVSLGMLFVNSLPYDSYTGYINMFRGSTFNNISYYESTGLNQILSTIFRIWQSVYEAGLGQYYQWEDWYIDDEQNIQNWQSVYLIDESRYFSLTPENIYQTYVGTNRIVIDDDFVTTITSDSATILTNAKWSTFIDKPA